MVKSNLRADFPILSRKVHGKQMVYLDSAATSQKPRQVIDAISDFYEKHNANVHRGIHTLGDEATRMYQDARETVAKFIGAADRRELVFVRGTTEAINLVAGSWGRKNIGRGDEIILTEMEHHSNIVPWQMLAKETGAIIKYLEVDDNGMLDLQDLKSKLSPKTKLIAVAHVSNFLGTINPIREISRIIKRSNLCAQRLDLNRPFNRPLLLVDGAQAVAHMPVNVRELDCDFYAFSGHKMYAPMGIGGLWARLEILEKMPPFMTGGGMIASVSTDDTTFADLPDRFDAGTPNVAGAVGLAAAVKYLQNIGMEKVRQHDAELVTYAMQRLQFKNSDLRINILGPNESRARSGLLAFTVFLGNREIHGHDVAQVLDSEGVAVRSGHHCTMPMHTKLGLAATTRASLGIYNSKSDINKLVDSLKMIPKIFGNLTWEHGSI